VVISSACGLLLLAFYGRLAALVARLRTFLELRESLEQVEFEGRFVSHAVEPSLADLRQETIE